MLFFAEARIKTGKTSSKASEACGCFGKYMLMFQAKHVHVFEKRVHVFKKHQDVFSGDLGRGFLLTIKNHRTHVNSCAVSPSLSD
ncbi:MAG: hypothetical protein K2F69_05445, partial [Bacteroidaceae bacterium]|nr:hypothetical protein [Bacteroidaceae bacterium]MDE6159519.1 hypothetical protein [Bacteroidaceae bacterium]